MLWEGRELCDLRDNNVMTSLLTTKYCTNLSSAEPQLISPVTLNLNECGNFVKDVNTELQSGGNFTSKARRRYLSRW